MSVIVRSRGFSRAEASPLTRDVWTYQLDRLYQSSPSPTTLSLPPHLPAYIFDRVFSPSDPTSQIFHERVRSQVERTLLGYSSTVLAYGQTSSGKTTTIRGGTKVEGLIELSTKHLLSQIASESREAVLKMSYLEIYNENVQDLLSGCVRLPIYSRLHSLHFSPSTSAPPLQLLPSTCSSTSALPSQLLHLRPSSSASPPQLPKRSCLLNPLTGLAIYERKGGGVVVADLVEKQISDWSYLHSPPRLLTRIQLPCTFPCRSAASELLCLGDERKHIGQTLHNDRSSRSHTAFRLSLEQGGVAGELNIVDLAGSERLSPHMRAGGASVQAARASEGAHINKSLLNSLGGNAFSTLICCVNPAGVHAEETHHSLRFATRARRVRTHPVIQQALPLPALIKKYEAEIRELKLQQSAIEETSVPTPSVGKEEEGGGGALVEREMEARFDWQSRASECSEATDRQGWSPPGVTGERLEASQRRVLILEKENARLVARRALLPDRNEAGGRSGEARQWKHRHASCTDLHNAHGLTLPANLGRWYMTEVLRRSSLERRNEELRKQLCRLKGDHATDSRGLPAPSHSGSHCEGLWAVRSARTGRLAFLDLNLPGS
ncbi:MAG: hypothetical protein SGPRY_010395 [Prymnesium sp.]